MEDNGSSPLFHASPQTGSKDKVKIGPLEPGPESPRELTGLKTLERELEPQEPSHLELWDEDGKKGRLDLQDMDGILGTSYEMLIKEAFRADKHFVVARMKSRHESSFTKQFSSFFSAFSVIKLIFKKKGEEIISRFHGTCGISAKNPITNHTIVGEVEFYLIRNIYLEKPEGQRYPPDKSLSLLGVRGEFLGTDYSYAHSAEMRDLVRANCLEDYQHLLNLDEYVHPLNDEWQVYLDRNVSDM